MYLSCCTAKDLVQIRLLNASYIKDGKFPSRDYLLFAWLISDWSNVKKNCTISRSSLKDT